MNRRIKAFRIIGEIIVTVTILLYFMSTKHRTLTSYTSFSILLLAEIIFFGGWILIERNANEYSQIMLRAGCGVVLSIYSMIASVVSIIFICGNKVVLMGLLINIQVLLLVAAIVLMIVFRTIAKGVKQSDDKVIQAVSRANGVMHRLTLLSQEKQNKAYEKKLHSLSEDMRYTDVSTSVACDDEIDTVLSKLEVLLDGKEETKDTQVLQKIEELSNLIHRRELQVRSTKVGQF